MSKRNTAEHILDVAQDLIQTGGFNAFSYQDIAARVGIRKASIHYHFPCKVGLGKAVIERYRQILRDLMRDSAAEPVDYWRTFDAYMEPYFVFARTGNKVCLCGALSGEYPALPKQMQKQVRAFFDENQEWLAELFARGRKVGAFQFKNNAKGMARTVFSALQGALLVERATGDRKHLASVANELKDRLRGQT